MRILHVSSAKTFGGGERHFVDLCRGLVERGHDVFVVLRPTNEWRERLDFIAEENIRYVSIRNSFGIFSSQKIAGFIKRKNIEIVHAHLARDYFPTSLACRIAKTPRFVLTRHVLFPMKSFYKFALTNLSRAIAVSGAVGGNLKTLFPEEKIVVINNGIDMTRSENQNRTQLRDAFRAENNIPPESLLIGTIGELKALKGQEDFVLAAQIIAEKFPDSRFAIIGKDNAKGRAFRRKLKRLVKVFDLKDRFLWLDWVEDTAAALAAFDVFVSPSHSESFGLAILEALSSGVPVVATDTAGAKELFKSLGTDRLVPIGEPAKMASAIEQFLTNEEEGRVFGRAAAQFVQEDFGIDKMISKTDDVYRSILK